MSSQGASFWRRFSSQSPLPQMSAHSRKSEEHGWKNMLSARPSWFSFGCYRKLYIFCIESRYLPTNTHNNKHHEYVFIPVVLSLRMLALSVGNYSETEWLRLLLALLLLRLLPLLLHSLLITQSVCVCMQWYHFTWTQKLPSYPDCCHTWRASDHAV